jgi:hypothetical protein
MSLNCCIVCFGLLQHSKNILKLRTCSFMLADYCVPLLTQEFAFVKVNFGNIRKLVQSLKE